MIAWVAIAAADPGAIAAAAALAFDRDGIDASAEQIDAAWRGACGAEAGPVCARAWQVGDLAAAGEALTPACDGGDALACLVVGWALADGPAGPLAANAPRINEAPARLEQACRGGVERGCVDLGALLQLGAGIPKDADRARALFQTACQVGELHGCRRLGAMYYAGIDAPRDLEQTRALYAKACDGGLPAGCNGLGLLAHLAGDASDPKAAHAHYIRACDAGHRGACTNLENLYAQGMRADQDPPGTLALWEQGCERGVPAACANGADLLEDALIGDARDPVRARALRERGCALGDPYTCGALGRSLLTSGDLTRGPTLLTESCEAGIVPSCVGLAELHEDRRGPLADVEAAVRLRASACVNGHAPSCHALADALWTGKGAERDREQARGLYRRACDADIPAACKRAR